MQSTAADPTTKQQVPETIQVATFDFLAKPTEIISHQTSSTVTQGESSRKRLKLDRSKLGLSTPNTSTLTKTVKEEVGSSLPMKNVNKKESNVKSCIMKRKIRKPSKVAQKKIKLENDVSCTNNHILEDEGFLESKLMELDYKELLEIAALLKSI